MAYAKHAGLQLCTNDYQNATVDLYGALFPDKPILVLKPGETLDTINSSENIVYDFGGFLDNRVADVAKQANVCVVPLFYQSNADLTAAAKTVIALRAYSKNIVIVINNTNSQYVPGLANALK